MELIFEKSAPGRRGASLPKLKVENKNNIPANLKRSQSADLPELSELDVIRHFTNLSRKNMSVDTNFYPLGSCTMKYNPKMHEEVVKLPGFSELHPLLPQLRHGGTLTQGALAVLFETQTMLAELMGFADCTMQPMAGAHGELTGVMLIAAYHRFFNDTKRKIMLIPDAAHGTNPASSAVAGFKCVTVASNANGGVDLEDLKSKLNENVAGLMLTCPNTLGLFDPDTEEICKLVHSAGALCYCDGANFNAIVGKIRPGDLGFDVMHVNVHKTFAAPHGGGGPGAGPVAVNEKLAPFLPVSRVIKRNDGTYSLEYTFKESIGYIAPFYGNFGVILKTYAYLLTLGKSGIRRISENAVLNANYIQKKLAPYYDQKYSRCCMHECVFCATRQLKKGVHALDVAKGLIDRGFHPPTIYFPLIAPEALMIEPTETESIQTMDKFITAMIEIAGITDENPESLHQAPVSTPVGRMDETAAARKPQLAN